MTEKYVPGALTALLSGKSPTSTERKAKKRKRVKEGEEASSSAASIFEKKFSTEKVPQLPEGESVITPKKVKLEDDKKDGKEIRPDGATSSRAQQRKNRVKKDKMSLEEKQRTVFVGNAPKTATRKQIKKLFSKFGPIETVRWRSVVASDEKTSKKVAALKNDISGRMNSMNFYVKFKEESSVNEALSMNGEKLEDHMLRVDSVIGKRSYEAKTTVFVGNLPYDVKEDALATHFEKAGDIAFVRIVRDSNTGFGKGFAFVAFKESAAIPIALKMDSSKFRKRQIRVTKIQKKRNRMVGNAENVRTPKKKASTSKADRLKAKKVVATNRKVFGDSDNENQVSGMKKGLRKLIKKKQKKKTKKSIMSS